VNGPHPTSFVCELSERANGERPCSTHHATRAQPRPRQRQRIYTHAHTQRPATKEKREFERPQSTSDGIPYYAAPLPRGEGRHGITDGRLQRRSGARVDASQGIMGWGRRAGCPSRRGCQRGGRGGWHRGCARIPPW